MPKMSGVGNGFLLSAKNACKESTVNILSQDNIGISEHCSYCIAWNKSTMKTAGSSATLGLAGYLHAHVSVLEINKHQIALEPVSTSTHPQPHDGGAGGSATTGQKDNPHGHDTPMAKSFSFPDTRYFSARNGHRSDKPPPSESL